MDTKEYLMQYRWTEDEIHRLLEEQTRWRALAERITPRQSDTPGSGSAGDRVGEAAAKIVDLERDIEEKVSELIILRREIVALVNRLPASREREVLLLRYLSSCTWGEVAERMGVSKQWALETHKRALAEIEAIMENKI